MAKAYECDVCGDFFKRNDTPDIAIVVYHYGHGDMRQDLCPKCQEELENWLKEKKGKRK